MKRMLPPAALIVGIAVTLPSPGAAQRADPDDVSTIDGIIRAYYEVVSVEAGQRADRERDRTLHHPDAIIGLPVTDSLGNTAIEMISLDEYHDRAGGPQEQAFHEWEIHRVEHRFGNVVHVWSTYASSDRPNGRVLSRGINSIQLFRDGTRWWIMSWVFDRERPDNPIPTEYQGRQ